MLKKIKTTMNKWYINLLARCARGYIRKHTPLVIGINGSVGKTTCRMIVHQTLQKFLPDTYHVSTSPQNFNGSLGFSLSIFEIEDITPSITSFVKTLCTCIGRRFFGKKKYDAIILEYGIDSPGEMSFLLNIARPDIGIFTKMDSVHSEQFGDPQAIAQEESKMIKATKEIAFLNADDTYSRQLYQIISIDKFLYITTGEEQDQLNIDPHISYTNETIYQDKKKHVVGSRITIDNMGKIYRIMTNLVGKENYGYISIAFALTEIVLFNIQQKPSNNHILHKKKRFFMEYELLPGRSQFFFGLRKSILLDSTYNASPKSVRKLTQTMYRVQQQLFPKHDLLFVIGDMRELGDFSEQEHRQLAPVVSVAENIVLIGEQVKYLQDELHKIGYDPDKIFHFDRALDAKKTLLGLIDNPKHPQCILFKGSQNTIYLEELLKVVIDHRKHPHDEEDQYLCRQSRWWKKKKQAFFDA